MTYHNAAAILADPATAVVERAPLTKVFEIVNHVVENRSYTPILGNARITGDGSALFVTGTDLDIELTVTIPAAVDSRFAVTLPAGKMRDLLKKATASDFVAFTMPEVEHQAATARNPEQDVFSGPATVDFERVKYRLNALHPNDFPAFTGPTPLNDPAYRAFKMPGAAFWSALDSVMSAISTEETRYYLNGIYMHVAHDGALRFVATDGHRLYRQDMAAPEGCDGLTGAIIPRKTVTLLHKLMKGKACPDHVEIEATETRLRVTWGDPGFYVSLQSKFIDGTFPDYERVIPSFIGGNMTATFAPETMLEAVRAVTLISCERGRAVKITMSADQMALDTCNPDEGSAHADIPATFDGHAGFEAGYNAGYLIDAIATASPNGADIKWRGEDAGSPAIFTGSRDGWMAVLMPMRV